MYAIFTQKTSDNGYRYPASFNDFTGNAYDDDFLNFWGSDNYYIKINLILLLFGLLLSIIYFYLYFDKVE